MVQRVGGSMRAVLRSSCAFIWSELNSKGASLRVSFTSGLARSAKSWIKIQTTLMVPRKARTSKRFPHGPHFRIATTCDSSRMTFISASVTKNNNFGNTEKELWTQKGSAAILHTLDDSIEIFEMFPNKSTDAWVLWNRVKCPVWSNVVRLGSFDQNVIDVWNHNV